MYVRGCVECAGRHVKLPAPAPNCLDVFQITVVPPTPARTMFVAMTSSRTRAGRATLKCTVAASRKPSPFGLTVASSRLSPAKGAEPSVT